MSREAMEPDGVAAARRIVEAKGRAPADGLGAPPGQGEALPFGAWLPPLSPSAGDLGEPGLQAAPGAGAASAPPRPDPRGASRRKRVDADHRSPVALSGPGLAVPGVVNRVVRAVELGFRGRAWRHAGDAQRGAGHRTGTAYCPSRYLLYFTLGP